MTQPETRTAAGQPHDRAALRDRIAKAIRDAACPGDCDKTEAECTRERIQPVVWHHGRLAAVEGMPEQFADVVLAVLPEPADQAAVRSLALLADELVERCPDHGCVEPGWETGCHCEIVPLLRRLAAEAQQPTAGEQARPVSPAALVEVRDPCPHCGDHQLVPRRQMAEHLARFHSDQPTASPTSGKQPDTRRERQRKYDKAVDARLPKLKGWNPIDRNIAGLGITDAVMVVADEEQQEMANATVAFTAAIRRQNDNLRAELEQARATTLVEAADALRDMHFTHGMSVQEIGTAFRHMASAARDRATTAPGVQAEDGAQQ